MPELPEVQTVVTDLSKKITGKTIASAEVLWPRTVAKPGSSDFETDLQGALVKKVSRRGKFIVTELEKYTASRTKSAQPKALSFFWLTHLRMTGQFHIPRGKKKIDNTHLRVKLVFTDGSHLLFTDPRKFARMYLVSNPEQVTGKLGPEPLEIKATEFIERLRGSKKMLKPLLLDQSFLSGVGNIYADESLHHAKLHPLTPAHKVTKDKAKKLHTGIQAVLKKGIELNGASIDRFYKRINGASGGFQDEFTVYGRTGLPCLRCGTFIRKTTVAQRGTHFCPSCQKPVRKSSP